MTTQAQAGTSADAAIRAAADEVRSAGPSADRRGRDPVNLPAIRTWQEALGDTDPRYEAEGVAPPAMIQVWTMPGLRGARTADDPLGRMTEILDAAGFTSVVATNCAQTYHRELRVGEQVDVSAVLTDVVGPKRTALGEGWFVTVVSTWSVATEPVAQMLFRILKFRPPGTEHVAPQGDPLPATDGPVTRPVVSRDTAFFWEGTDARELRIQRCDGCGALRHPPGPLCPLCGAERTGWVVHAGAGAVHSWVRHHHPPTPGRTPPYVVVLVDLGQGLRMLGELLDPPEGDLTIGAPVRLAWQDGGDGLVLPAWRLGGEDA